MNTIAAGVIEICEHDKKVRKSVENKCENKCGDLMKKLYKLQQFKGKR